MTMSIPAGYEPALAGGTDMQTAPGDDSPTSQEAAPCAQRMPSQSCAQPEDRRNFTRSGTCRVFPERAAASTLGSRWLTSTHCPSPSVKVAWELTLSAAGGIGCTVGTQPMVHQQQRIARRAVVTARARHAGPRLPTQQVLTPAWLRSRARSLSSSAARTAWTRPWLLPTSVSGGCGALLWTSFASTGAMTSGVSPLHHPHPVPIFIDRAFASVRRDLGCGGPPGCRVQPELRVFGTLTGAVELEVTDG